MDKKSKRREMSLSSSRGIAGLGFDTREKHVTSYGLLLGRSIFQR